MLRVLTGVRYDTDTAHEIGEAQHGEYVTDFHFWRASLCKTPRSGRYFLAGWGGPMTLFARPDGDGLTAGEQIFPMTPTEARDWAMRYLPAHRFEREFGEGGT